MSSQALILDSGDPNTHDISDLCSGCSDEIKKKSYHKTRWYRAQSFCPDLSPIHVVLHVLSILVMIGLSASLISRRVDQEMSCNRKQSVYCMWIFHDISVAREAFDG